MRIVFFCNGALQSRRGEPGAARPFTPVMESDDSRRKRKDESHFDCAFCVAAPGLHR